MFYETKSKIVDYVRPGDKIIIESLSRLSRSAQDCKKMLNDLNQQGVELVSLKEGFVFTKKDSANNQFILSILMLVSEWERESLLEKQREGIEIAKKKGKFKGRQPIAKPFNFDQLYDKYRNSTRENRYKLRDFQREVGLKPSTLFKFIKLKKKEEENKRQ